MLLYVLMSFFNSEYSLCLCLLTLIHVNWMYKKNKRRQQHRSSINHSNTFTYLCLSQKKNLQLDQMKFYKVAEVPSFYIIKKPYVVCIVLNVITRCDDWNLSHKKSHVVMLNFWMITVTAWIFICQMLYFILKLNNQGIWLKCKRFVQFIVQRL